MLIEKDYCDKETAFALQELGYNPYMFYDDGTPAIHLWYAQKWLREEKGVIVGIITNFTIQAFDWHVSTWEEDLCRGNKYSSYEDALQRGIKEAVKILKNGLDSKR